MFITLEGGEGAGKSTQAEKLRVYLEQLGIKTWLTREPGGSAGAEMVRKLLLEGPVEKWDGIAEAYLFAAARADHVQHTIKPKLADGYWVICDRFVDSSIAYQGHGRGLGPSWIRNLNHHALGGLVPDITFILDIPAQAGFRRIVRTSAGADRFEMADIDFHLRVRLGFQVIHRQSPWLNVLINADRSVEEVHESLVLELQHRFGINLGK